MLSKKLKTDVGMLPQFQPLEERTARHAAGSARNGCARDAACQLAQGESVGNVNPSALPRKLESGVTRIFVLSKYGYGYQQIKASTLAGRGFLPDLKDGVSAPEIR